MSATNHTTNYELPIFVGTDKPAWLVDWNGAMTAIDTAIHTAEGKADQAGTDIGGIESSISTINGTLTSINNAVSQLRIDTNANTGNINTINSLIGNGEPTTTDKTIIGAINEINGEVFDFNFVQSTGISVTAPSGVGTIVASDINILHNADNSAGKVYGRVAIGSGSVPSGTDPSILTIANSGISVDTPFDVKGYAIMYADSNGDFKSLGLKLRFSNNQVDCCVIGSFGSTVPHLGIQLNLPPCLLFLNDMGD